ncbi:hypothetical protein COL77_30590 [Bacillus wiedmannii]|uniref:hypothetical protein n=1 Tax=Bacillus wiedmannii TaxID=1890302 RepID=UPI000BF5541C|nr:hypothetical protein [Bacillus wiedmannii]PFZ33869.1 hypothetical protein COL77_30590 [Bacillus wiedmannii]
MGTFTAFRGKVIIKEEYKELVELINNGEWRKAVDIYPFLKEYYEIERSTLIPFSKDIIQKRLNLKGELDLQIDPCDWETESEYFTNLKGLEWTFITCLKNYQDRDNFNRTPIESFIDIVLTKIVSQIIRVEKYSEAWCDYSSVGYEFDKTVVNKIVGTLRFKYFCENCERPIYMCDGECQII